MFNCPTYTNKRELCKPIEFPKTKKVYNLIPKAEKLKDAAGKEYNGIVYETVLVDEYDIQEYIESFSDEVGIQNILKKLSLSGDKSILNQTGREALCPDGGLEPIQDYSNVPSSKAEAFNIVAQGVAAYDNLPEDIKAKMSLSQFVSEFGQAQFDAYVENLKQKYAPKEEDK